MSCVLDRRRLAASLVVAVLMLTVGACGSDDGSGSGGGDATQAARAPASGGSAGGSEEEVIRLLLRDMDDKMRAGDPAACDVMSEPAQRNLVDIAKSLGKKVETCEQAVTKLLVPLKATNAQTPRSKILAIRVNGPKATVLVEAPETKSHTRTSLVKVDGQWKVGASKGVEPGAGAY